MARIAVIGSGMGGLSAAISLAAKGHSVDVFEAANGPGGKAGTHTVDGCTFDTGPSVLTLPHVAESLFSDAGQNLSDSIELIQASPAFRYSYADGTRLDVHHNLSQTAESIGCSLGVDAQKEFEKFMVKAEQIWETAAPNFVYGDAPSLWSVFKLGPAKWWDLNKINGLQTMWSTLQKDISSPHLRDLLARYSTYNGSDPRQAPATLHCIAHVEMGMGGFGVKGGIQRLVIALHNLATNLGVQFHFNNPVKRIRIEQRRCTGLLVNGEWIGADAVVVNADAELLRDTLAPESAPSIPKTLTPSMSGYNLVVRTKANTERAGHNVHFPKTYLNEFRDIFDEKKAPEEPTVYACDPTIAHAAEGWSDGTVPLFLMANVPPTSMGEINVATLRSEILKRAEAIGWISASDSVVWERTPTELAQRFPGSHGSLYGSASHGIDAAFRRPANEVRGIKGLFLASGSAHPGGGVPLAMLSGMAASRRVIHHIGSAQ